MKWNIVIDSASDMREGFLTPEIYLSVVPMKVVIDGCEYQDDESLDLPAMMDMMKIAHKTGSSCPAPEEYLEKFAQGDNVIAISISSQLSGSYQSACIARDQVLQADPGRNLFVLDSKRASGAMELLVLRLQELIEQGMAFDEVVREISAYAATVQVLFTLECFDNLIKNGRMSRSAAIVASILGIRPIAMGSPEGTIQVIEKPRGVPKALMRIVENMQKMKGMDVKTVIISHCNNLDVATRLHDLIQQMVVPTNILIRQMRGLCSYYADQRGIIVSF